MGACAGQVYNRVGSGPAKNLGACEWLASPAHVADAPSPRVRDGPSLPSGCGPRADPCHSTMQPAASVGNQPLIPLEEGWAHIKGGIQRLEDLLSTDFDSAVAPFTPAEYMAIYSCVPAVGEMGLAWALGGGVGCGKCEGGRWWACLRPFGENAMP